ncbi:hypothetical protein [Arenibaculum pallidiluteum]|uniref:hypothetical protein n=1 Tax=Arenibaculum pallidiluteum TaxID=2812559 RepID=UPI001A97B42D|nr:hypothetical protein [Arenibaculum pallidiluteum]
MSFEQVEEAWQLSDDARAHSQAAGRDLSPQEYWDQFFSASPLVDAERTLREGGQPVARIFLRSPYGLQWRPDHKDWIPFRHGEIPPFAG